MSESETLIIGAPAVDLADRLTDTYPCSLDALSCQLYERLGAFSVAPSITWVEGVTAGHGLNSLTMVPGGLRFLRTGGVVLPGITLDEGLVLSPKGL